MIQYYKTIKQIGDTTNIGYWKGDSDKIHSALLSMGFDLILPLGNKKPKNIPSHYFATL